MKMKKVNLLLLSYQIYKMGNTKFKTQKNYTQPTLKPSNIATSNLTTTSLQFYNQHCFPPQCEVPAQGILSRKHLSAEQLKQKIHSKPDNLTLLTYNVWFQEKNKENRYPCILKMLADSGADVICLQEVNQDFLDLLHSYKDLFKNYQQYYVPVMAMHWYDTLILSKYPCRFYKKLFETSGMGRCVLTAVFQFEDVNKKSFKLGVNCVHLQSLNSTKQRINQINTINGLNKDMDMSIIAGDFNFSDGWQEDKSIEEYHDLWKVGKRHLSKWATQQMHLTGYTMPKTTQFPSWRPDHIIVKSKNKMQNADKNEIEIIGDFTITPYSEQLFRLIQKDGIVRTPSDHFGLMSRIYL